MRLEDTTQNLPARIRAVQVIVFVLLVALVVRLYTLQVVDGELYAEKAASQHIRILPIPAPRGVIFDRYGRILVNSRPTYNVILSREELRGKDLSTLIAPLSRGLGLDPDYLREHFDEIKSIPAFESINVKENATQADISWVESHALEFPALRIERQPQRRYPDNGLLAHVLGYVSEIGPKQLEQPEYKDKGYKAGDIIGREGLEAVYDQYLRGRDGYRTVVVDTHGHIQDVIEEVPPQPGQDMVTTIDLDLQKVAEEELRNTPSQRGVIIAMDPNNGEILAMASYPTFDPNLFTERIKTREGRAEYVRLLRDPDTPLYNRAIRGRYPPGSTWKIPMAVAGLRQGAISIDESRLLCGGGILIGNKFTRCMGNHGMPDLHTAIMKSCDGYFYRLGLKMGLDGIMKMVDEFDLNKKTGIDLPHELISWTPSREFKARWNPRDPKWRDIDTVYASFGQVYEFVTPLALLRAEAGIGTGGRLYVPHLMKEFRAVGLEGQEDYRPARRFIMPSPKVVPIPHDQHQLVVKGMWSVVNGAGTAARIRMEGFDIAGKTGTAQVVELGKDVGRNKDHSWFVSYAPAFEPEISVLALIENVGFGSTYAAPAVRAVYDIYYQKTRGEGASQDRVAKLEDR